MTDTPQSPPIIAIVGWKKSGKTTLTTRLIEEFSRRGLRISTVKHAHHGFRIDDAQTDSAHHRRAGAAQVGIVSGKRWAIVSELAGEPEPALLDFIGKFEPCDLVIAEGFKGAPVPKIEARRAEAGRQRPLADTDPLVLAVATDIPGIEAAVPVFGLDDIAGLADFIAASLQLPRGRKAKARPAPASLAPER